MKDPLLEHFRSFALLDDDAPMRGFRRVARCVLPGWQALLEKYGTMTLAQILEPAIRIADEGFPVTPIIARDWQNTAELLRKNDAAAATFLPGGQAPKAGTWATWAMPTPTWASPAAPSSATSSTSPSPAPFAKPPRSVQRSGRQLGAARGIS